MATLIVHFQVVAETARVFGNLSRRSDIRMVKAQKILSFMADIVLQRNAPFLYSLKRLCIKLRLTEIKFVYLNGIYALISLLLPLQKQQTNK